MTQEGGFAVSVTEPDGDPVVLSVEGELDVATASRLAEILEPLTERSARPRVVIDVSGLTFCDSTGLSVLVRAHNALAEGGGRLVLRAPSDRLVQVLEVSGLREVLHVETE